MHLFAAKPGAAFDDGAGIVDLEQSPAELIILSGADSVLSLLAAIGDQLPQDYPSLRLVNTLHLSKPAAFDLWQDRVLDRTGTEAPQGARVVLLSLLGGIRYWRYGVEALQSWAQQHNAALIVVPGEDIEDHEVLSASTVEVKDAYRLWRYLREGGPTNAERLFAYLRYRWLRPDDQAVLTLPSALEVPSAFRHSEYSLSLPPALGTLILVIYRSHVQAANTTVFDHFAEILAQQGFRVVTVAITSLKQAASLSLLEQVIDEESAVLVINTTGFAIARSANDALSSRPTRPSWPLQHAIPVLQAALASTQVEDWQTSDMGLCTRDIAMQVALPELDGRIITRAVGFKAALLRHERSQYDSVRFVLQPGRAQFVAELAAHWRKLQQTPRSQRRLMLVLANYPADEASIGNGIGLDTLTSTVGIMRLLAAEGYQVSDIPENSDDLIARLKAGVTNSASTLFNPFAHGLLLDDYCRHYAQLPDATREAVEKRWGAPAQDRRLIATSHGLAFPIAGLDFGHLFVGIQPMRGYDIDQAALYHDATLVPPHSYLAFHFWMRHHLQTQAVIHMGTHGNVEWLPGKSLALSAQCWPEIALGPLPNIYPFIVNDPGEGAQAKRRTQAVLISHLTPPLMQADIHGHLAELEQLMDEYYQALNVDAQREAYLRQQILMRARETHVLEELTTARHLVGSDDDTLLLALDAWLCDIKESQVRSGLHILGELPKGALLVDQLLSLLRIPRTLANMQHSQASQDQGLLHALAHDLGLPHDFDPLARSAAMWTAQRPVLLAQCSTSVWRTEADTRERLEQLARQLIQDYVIENGPETLSQDKWPATYAVLNLAHYTLLPALQDSARLEHHYLLEALDGRAVPAGASGSPARGRWDILPTGRNMHTLDSRAIPSPSAWVLGQQAAEQLIERYLQEHGDYPQWVGMTLWGSTTLRTGGDDVAQALALLGVRPLWAPGSSRIADIEIIPAFRLGRPRVDVTLRISGFFRDAFPNLILLLDKAITALSQYEEPGTDNTIRQHVITRQKALQATGVAPDQARQMACHRVFGSAAGHYGSGLATLLECGHWQDQEALAEAYIRWGGHVWQSADNDQLEQHSAYDSFADQLRQLDIVLHNRDLLEQDLLDATDHAQFQGGMANASYSLSSTMPALYVGDHTQPAALRLQSLSEALTQTLHARVLNPRWQHAMHRHGYKGAAEISHCIDSLIAFDATTRLIADHQYAQVGASLLHPDNQHFMQRHNPDALRHIVCQLMQAIRQGLWHASSEWRQYLETLLIQLEQTQEERT